MKREWKIGPALPGKPRGRARRLLESAAMTVGAVLAAAPLAACNCKSCRFEDTDGFIKECVDGGVDGGLCTKCAPGHPAVLITDPDGGGFVFGCDDCPPGQHLVGTPRPDGRIQIECVPVDDAGVDASAARVPDGGGGDGG